MIPLAHAILYSSAQGWRTSGPNALVKVMNLDRGTKAARSGQAGGYFTQAKFLNGMNAYQIESGLGLQPNELARGCYVFYFSVLPDLKDVDFRFYASMPNLKIWDRPGPRDKKHEATTEAYLAARAARDLSGSDVVESWPPGSPRILQWTFHRHVNYTLSQHYFLITPSTTFYAG